MLNAGDSTASAVGSTFAALIVVSPGELDAIFWSTSTAIDELGWLGSSVEVNVVVVGVSVGGAEILAVVTEPSARVLEAVLETIADEVEAEPVADDVMLDELEDD